MQQLISIHRHFAPTLGVAATVLAVILAACAPSPQATATAAPTATRTPPPTATPLPTATQTATPTPAINPYGTLAFGQVEANEATGMTQTESTEATLVGKIAAEAKASLGVTLSEENFWAAK